MADEEKKFSSNEEFLAEMERRRQAQTIAEVSQAVESAKQFSSKPARDYGDATDEKGLVGLVLKTGLVKTKQQADGVLVGILVAVLALTGWVIFH